MKKITINILASDFQNNSFHNYNADSTGCPIMRGLFRAGITDESKMIRAYCDGIPQEAELKVQLMFRGEEPTRDFSFEVEVPC